MRPMFGVSVYSVIERVKTLIWCHGQTYNPRTSVTFVSQASITSGAIESYGLRKRVEAVRNCRNIGKKDMKFNGSMPEMNVDPETYVSTCLSVVVIIL